MIQKQRKGAASPFLLVLRRRLRGGIRCWLSTLAGVQFHRIVHFVGVPRQNRLAGALHTLPGDHHLGDVGSEGTSYISCVNIPSITARRPRAPMFRSMALSAMASSASGANSRSTSSYSSSFLYCFTRAFSAPAKSGTRSPRCSALRGQSNRRPTSSGIRPNFRIS